MPKENSAPSLFREYFDTRQDSFSVLTLLACLASVEQDQEEFFGKISKQRTASMLADSLKIETKQTPKILGYAKVIEGETSQVILNPNKRQTEVTALLLNPLVEVDQLSSGLCVVEVSILKGKIRHLWDKIQVVINGKKAAPLDIRITEPLANKLKIHEGDEIFISNLRIKQQ